MSRLLDTGFIKQLRDGIHSWTQEEPRIPVLPMMQKRLEEQSVRGGERPSIGDAKRDIYSNVGNMVIFFGILVCIYLFLQFRMNQKRARQSTRTKQEPSIDTSSGDKSVSK